MSKKIGTPVAGKALLRDRVLQDLNVITRRSDLMLQRKAIDEALAALPTTPAVFKAKDFSSEQLASSFVSHVLMYFLDKTVGHLVIAENLRMKFTLEFGLRDILLKVIDTSKKGKYEVQNTQLQTFICENCRELDCMLPLPSSKEDCFEDILIEILERGHNVDAYVDDEYEDEDEEEEDDEVEKIYSHWDDISDALETVLSHEVTGAESKNANTWREMQNSNKLAMRLNGTGSCANVCISIDTLGP